MNLDQLEPGDKWAVEQFINFLGWGIRPRRQSDNNPPRPIPPAVWAFMLNATDHCPPKGTM